MKAGKVWGMTELIHANGILEFHRIDTKKGGVCSKHKHKHKWNGFFVEKGKLLIRTWKNDYDMVDETLLEDGDWHVAKPGEYHQFEALEDTVAFELYWPMLLIDEHPDDIERETHGFAKEKK